MTKESVLRSTLLAAATAAAVVTPVLALAPELAVYVTDADEDIYVALYGHVAIELVACEGVHEARAVLQLPAGTEAVETTLANLEADFGFGTHPRIPCGSDAEFDMDWPATTPIWADLTDSGNYYLPAPDGGTLFYALPSGCTGIKTALAIRERLQLPGVLQGLIAPVGLDMQLVLECGTADETIVDPRVTPSLEARSSLHRFDTFLTAESTGDTIYVARYQPSGEGALPAYLPIWRVNGRAASEIILSGGEVANDTEAALRDFFGIPTTAAVTLLGAEAVAAVRSAVHADLCVSVCEGYVHRHAAFLNPAIDLGLTGLGTGTVTRRLSRLGDEQLVWNFEGEREAVLTECDRVSAALGLQIPGATDWMASVDAALVADPQAGAAFACQDGPAETCLRQVADGAPLTQALFDPGADCPGARRLRIELPAAVRTSAPLFLSGTDFDTIELTPSPGVTRSIVTGTPGRLTAGSASCILSSTQALVFADRLPRLEIRNVSLRRTDDEAGQVVALQVQNGALVLDDVSLGGEAEGTRPVARGVTLCLADLYAADSSIHARSLGIQGVSARVLLSGTTSSPTLIAQPRYGLLLSAASAVRLHHAQIVARTPLVLRGGRAIANRTELSAGAGSTKGSTALMLERGASAAFTSSTVGGFRCVASFTDVSSKASFVLPGNDLAQDNTHLACGEPGQFTLLE